MLSNDRILLSHTVATPRSLTITQWRLRTLPVVLLLVAVLPASIRTTAAGPTNSGISSRFQEQRQHYHEEFQEGLERLIADCRAKGLDSAVRTLLPWREPVDVESLSGRAIPRKVQPDVPLSLPSEERRWRLKFRNLRQELAKDLYLLSRRVLNADYPNTAWRLIHEVVHYAPDHERARSLLGYERFGNEWVTPFAARKMRSGFVWHDRFGWLPKTHVERYENGERVFLTQWHTAQREAELRRAWNNAWEVETDHYQVKTNVSLEKGVELARKLEVFHAWFERSFPPFFNTPEQLRKLFAGSAHRRRRIRDPFIIHFYRTKDEYVQRLQRDNPQIAITNGIYMPDQRIAHFYPDPNSDIESTIYHEATHQILYEIDSRPRAIGEREHFWVVEGFACYMESFRPTDDGVSVGNPDYPRFYWARHRLVKENFFIPLGRFASLGKNAFQSPAQIRQRYSQASGLVHFYMHGKEGQYRDAFINHIAALYRPLRPGYRVGGMDEFTGVPYEALGQQYREYISTLDSNPLGRREEGIENREQRTAN